MEKYAKNICKLKKVLNIDSEDDEAQIYGIEIFPNLYLSGEYVL